MQLLDKLPGTDANTWIIVLAWGLGDTHIVAGLCKAFRKQYCQQGQKLYLVVKYSHMDLAVRFDGPTGFTAVGDHELEVAAFAAEFRTTIQPGVPFFAHPSLVPVRGDHCVAHHPMSDVAMYAMILGLPPSTPLSLPRMYSGAAHLEAESIAKPLGVVPGRTVILVTETRSWPARIPDDFWIELQERLRGEGWTVITNDAKAIPLRCVAPLAEIAGWVIGANCGLMQSLVCGRVRCRKTIITEKLEPHHGYPLPVTSTFPYRLTRKIDGNVYDIEEFLAEHGNYQNLIDMIAQGRNARGPEPSPDPQMVCDVPLSPGEVIDRLTVLSQKWLRLPEKRHMLRREMEMLKVHRHAILCAHPDVAKLEVQLAELNAKAWDNNQILFDEMSSDDPESWWWVHLEDLDKAKRCLAAFKAAGIDANQERVRIKNRINVLCGSGAREEKSYDT